MALPSAPCRHERLCPLVLFQGSSPPLLYQQHELCLRASQTLGWFISYGHRRPTTRKIILLLTWLLLFPYSVSSQCQHTYQHPTADAKVDIASYHSCYGPTQSTRRPWNPGKPKHSKGGRGKRCCTRTLSIKLHIIHHVAIALLNLFCQIQSATIVIRWCTVDSVNFHSLSAKVLASLNMVTAVLLSVSQEPTPAPTLGPTVKLLNSKTNLKHCSQTQE